MSSSLTSGLRATASPGADRALSGKIHTNDRLLSVSFSRSQWEKKTLALTEKLGALYLTVVLICISRRTGDVDHLYVHRLAICMPLQQCLLEWLSSKRQVITNASEEMEKREILCTVSGDVNYWHSIFSEKMDRESKVKVPFLCQSWTQNSHETFSVNSMEP